MLESSDLAVLQNFAKRLSTRSTARALFDR
jgi:hypothetical protein